MNSKNPRIYVYILTKKIFKFKYTYTPVQYRIASLKFIRHAPWGTIHPLKGQAIRTLIRGATMDIDGGVHSSEMPRRANSRIQVTIVFMLQHIQNFFSELVLITVLGMKPLGETTCASSSRPTSFPEVEIQLEVLTISALETLKLVMWLPRASTRRQFT